ncbi:ubiquitin-protein transferase [Aureococcus anophagefferens]|nr:ubiquitin-protein transferase [Aureococcus anophagefferens]
MSCARCQRRQVLQILTGSKAKASQKFKRKPESKARKKQTDEIYFEERGGREKRKTWEADFKAARDERRAAASIRDVAGIPDGVDVEAVSDAGFSLTLRKVEELRKQLGEPDHDGDWVIYYIVLATSTDQAAKKWSIEQEGDCNGATACNILADGTVKQRPGIGLAKPEEPSKLALKPLNRANREMIGRESGPYYGGVRLIPGLRNGGPPGAGGLVGWLDPSLDEKHAKRVNEAKGRNAEVARERRAAAWILPRAPRPPSRTGAASSPALFPRAKDRVKERPGALAGLRRTELAEGYSTTRIQGSTFKI